MTDKSQGIVSGYLQQQMLIAMPAMDDPNFSRSVTLLCQHNEEGAIGITINRQSTITLGELFKQLDISCDNSKVSSLMVLEGGPVNTDRGFVLHTPVEGYDSSIKINDDIMVTTSRDILSAIAAGEGPQQPADKGILFESALNRRWEQAVGKLGIDIKNLHGVGGHA